MRVAPVLAAVALLLVVGVVDVSAAPAPKPIDRASSTAGPDGVAITPDDVKELEAMQAAIGRFEEAQRDYRGTVSHIVKQEFEKKRKELQARYSKQIEAAEREEAFRREDAIVMFEKFLAKYPKDKRWTPDVIFRLAELYFEKITDAYLQVTANPATAAAAATGPDGGTGTGMAQIDYTKVIELYKQLITDFPDYRLIDGAYYLLGYCLDKMGKEPEARQSFLALVCTNKFKPLDTPAPPAPSKGRGSSVVFVDPYKDCKAIKEESRFTPEAWTRIGEFHFDYNELELAIAAYARVLVFKDSPYYDKALYKLAWAYYRADKYPEAIKRFDELVLFSDTQKAASGKEGSDLRAESVQYLGISFAEKDWNGDSIDDSESGLQRIESFYKGREAETHVRDIFQKLGDIYFDETEYPKAIEVYKRMLAKWPYDPANPKVQDRIVLCLERLRNFEQALKAREDLARNYSKGTDWYKKNRDNKEATDTAAELAETNLAKSAVDHHRAAQAMKKLALASSPPDGAKLSMASREYASAAQGYEKYLELFTNSKNSYEYTYFYAESLYYSAQFAAAATQYEKVRDSNLDNKYLEDSAFNAVKSYEQLIDVQIKQGKFNYPPAPAVGKTPNPVVPTPIPDDVKKLQAAYESYARIVPSSGRLGTMAYKGAEINFKYLHWDEARPKFEEILTKYCKSVDNIALEAGKAILTSYTIENNLDKIVEWTEKLNKANCGTGKAAEEDKTKRKQLADDARFKQADALFAAKDFEKASQAYIDIVNSDPKNAGGNNDKALYNAAVGYENVKRFLKATQVYERITSEYPSSEFVDDALFRTAVNYQRFFEFDKAVVSYQRLATDKRFADSKNRTDSLYNAAVLLENDQAYDQAAKLFQTYSTQNKVKPEERSEAYFRSGLIYLKSKQVSQTIKTFREYIRSYPGDAKRVVEAQFHIAEAFELQKDKKSVMDMYRKVSSMGASVPAASDAAEYPAQASFLLAEEQLAGGLEKMKLLGGKEFPKSLDKFKAEVARLTAEYNHVLVFKRATWTLAAFFRIGYIYELLSKALANLVNSPCPAEIMRKYKQEGCDVYTQGIQQQIEPVVASVDEEVVKRYRTVLEQAAKLGVSNKWTKLARQKANAYKPDEFPMIKDEKVDFQMEPPQ